MTGYLRLEHIVKLSKSKKGSGEIEIERRPRETDMVRRVMAIAGIVSSKSALGVFDNTEMKMYVQKLDPQHTPPHRLERIRIVEVMIDAYMREWAFILEDRRDVLHEKFLSGEIGECLLTYYSVKTSSTMAYRIVLFSA